LLAKVEKTPKLVAGFASVRKEGHPSAKWACPQRPRYVWTWSSYSWLVRQWDKAIVRDQQPWRRLGPLRLEAAWCYQHQRHWECH